MAGRSDPSGDAGPALVGRDRELATIQAAADRAIGGRGTVVAVVGEAGIGKTRLLDEVAAGLPGEVVVHRARARPVAVERPFSVLLDLLDVRLTDLLPAPPDLRGVLDTGAHGWAGAVVADVLLDRIEDLAATTPAVVAIDDLQWADPSSLEVLRAVAGRVAGLPLAVVVASRPPEPGTEHGALLGDLAHHGHPAVELGRLPAPAARALAAARLGAEVGASETAAVDRAAGHPLLVLAVADALRRGGSDPARSSVLTARVAQLDRQDLSVAQAAAVLGAPVRPDDLAAVGGWPLAVVLEATDRARACGVLADDDQLGFLHDLVRDEVLATLGPAARRALHQAAARRCIERGAPTAEIAGHLAAGARPGDREAVAWLERAAAELAGHAPAAALRTTDAAFALLGDQPPDDGLLLVRVQALAGVGRAAEAGTLARSMLRPGTDPDIERRVRRELALCAVIEGRPRDAATEMDRVADLTGDPALRARVQAEASYAHLLALDGDEAGTRARSAEVAARAAGDHVATVGALCVQCLSDTFAGRLDAAGERAEEILRLAALPGTGAASAYQPWFAAGLALLELGRHDDALVAAAAGRAAVERSGTTWASPAYDALEANLRLQAGQLDRARAAAEASLAAAARDVLGVAVWSHVFVVQVEALVGGDDAVVAEHLDAAESMLVSGNGQLGSEMVLWQRGLHLERTGAPDRALAILAPLWDTFAAFGFWTALVPIGADLARLAVTCGDRDRARQVADGVAAVARRLAVPGVVGQWQRARAWAEADPGAAWQAAEQLGGARPVVRAMALADAAGLHRAAGEVAEADRAAAAAADAFVALGAHAAAHRVAGNLATGRRAPRPVEGLDALTDTERLVVDLVAEGLANGEIAQRLTTSKRTVESHVSAAYRKLGVTTRVGLARAALATATLG